MFLVLIWLFTQEFWELFLFQNSFSQKIMTSFWGQVGKMMPNLLIKFHWVSIWFWWFDVWNGLFNLVSVESFFFFELSELLTCCTWHPSYCGKWRKRSEGLSLLDATCEWHSHSPQMKWFCCSFDLLNFGKSPNNWTRTTIYSILNNLLFIWLIS